MIKSEVLEKVYESIFEEKPPVLQTGFRDLDTIGARPAMGKTSFATNIMLNLLEQNKKCLFFSLEMSEEQAIKRLLGQIGEVDSMLLRNLDGILRRKQSVEKIAEALNKISKYDLTIIDDVHNADEIKEQCTE